jgi:hypothetical protein
MGSLTSRPKIPSSPQVVYRPVASTPANNPATPTPATPPPSGQAGGDEGASRAASLLLRDRGRFGTVLTGFRGLLAPMNDSGGRKTLLGE